MKDKTGKGGGEASRPEIKVRIKPHIVEKIKIADDFIRLDALLKFAAMVQTGGEAKMLIQDGQVRVNGEICVQRGKKIRDGDKIGFAGQELLIEAGPDS